MLLIVTDVINVPKKHMHKFDKKNLYPLDADMEKVRKLQ